MMGEISPRLHGEIVAEQAIAGTGKRYHERAGVSKKSTLGNGI